VQAIKADHRRSVFQRRVKLHAGFGLFNDDTGDLRAALEVDDLSHPRGRKQGQKGGGDQNGGNRAHRHSLRSPAPADTD